MKAQSPTNPDRFDALLTSEAARILRVSAETVRLWERSGRLPAQKTGRGVRLFDRRDVLRLAQETIRSPKENPQENEDNQT
jgi:excisionase family DNA binding protein